MCPKFYSPGLRCIFYRVFVLFVFHNQYSHVLFHRDCTLFLPTKLGWKFEWPSRQNHGISFHKPQTKRCALMQPNPKDWTRDACCTSQRNEAQHRMLLLISSDAGLCVLEQCTLGVCFKSIMAILPGPVAGSDHSCCDHFSWHFLSFAGFFVYGFVAQPE